jgi:hypothetical protein
MDDTIGSILERNQLRGEAGLPPLDVEIETARLAAVRADADFEDAFAKYRDQVFHEWTGNSGYFANLARYSSARQRFRAEQSSK